MSSVQPFRENPHLAISTHHHTVCHLMDDTGRNLSPESLLHLKFRVWIWREWVHCEWHQQTHSFASHLPVVGRILLLFYCCSSWCEHENPRRFQPQIQKHKQRHCLPTYRDSLTPQFLGHEGDYIKIIIMQEKLRITLLPASPRHANKLNN